MVEETPRRQCQPSKDKEERGVGACGDPGEVAFSLGCAPTVARRWAGRGALREGQLRHPALLVSGSPVVQGWAGSKV